MSLLGADPARCTPGSDQESVDPVRLVASLLVWVGSLFALFALYQLWGTGLLEWRAQRALEHQLEAQLAAVPAAPEAIATGPDGWDVAQPAEIGTPAGHPTGPGADPSAADDGPGSGAIPPPTLPTPRTPAPAPAPATPLTDQAMAAEAPPAEAEAGPASETEPAPVSIVPPLTSPSEGEALGRLVIPAIDLSKAVVEGVDRATLRTAPGRYPSTALPGTGGNIAIAGHRTTHGAPFLDLDLLAPGDEITLETPTGTYTYQVEGHDGTDGPTGHRIVDPSAVEVLADTGDDRLTLTACHPKYSAAQRIVVTAILVEEEPRGGGSRPAGPLVGPTPTGEPAPALVPDLASRADLDARTGDHDPAGPSGAATTPGSGSAAPDAGAPGGAEVNGEPPASSVLTSSLGDEGGDSLGWQGDELEAVVLWFTIFALISHGGWILGRLWRRTPAYGLSGLLATGPLFLCFLHLDRLLPAF